MTSWLRSGRLRLLLVALYALAALSLGVMPAMAGPATTSDLSAFTLPGQASPILCLTGDPAAPGTADTHDLCAACVLIGAAGTGILPAIDVVTARDARTMTFHLSVRHLTVTADIWPVSRGPPAARA
jgi:hypothetical protein